MRLDPKPDPQFSSRQSLAKKPALKPFPNVSFCGAPHVGRPQNPQRKTAVTQWMLRTSRSMTDSNAVFLQFHYGLEVSTFALLERSDPVRQIRLRQFRKMPQVKKFFANDLKRFCNVGGKEIVGSRFVLPCGEILRKFWRRVCATRGGKAGKPLPCAKLSGGSLVPRTALKESARPRGFCYGCLWNTLYPLYKEGNKRVRVL